MQTAWADFMTPDKATMRYWAEMRRKFPDFQLCLFDRNKLVGVGNSIPIIWSGQEENLPASWAETLIRGVDNERPDLANTLSAVNIAIHTDYQKSGLSRLLLTKFRELAHEKGIEKMIVPARLSFKVNYPLAKTENYIHWKRKDGEPFDPWIRTHWRLGARIIKPFDDAFTVTGTVEQWEEWTGMNFPESGVYVIKGASQPLQIDLSHNIGVYNDPPVWMQYL